MDTAFLHGIWNGKTLVTAQAADGRRVWHSGVVDYESGCVTPLQHASTSLKMGVCVERNDNPDRGPWDTTFLFVNALLFQKVLSLRGYDKATQGKKPETMPVAVWSD